MGTDMWRSVLQSGLQNDLYERADFRAVDTEPVRTVIERSAHLLNLINAVECMI